MANVDRPCGFAPVRYLNGAPWNGAANIYSIAAAYNTVLAIGDPVKSSGTADDRGVPGIVLGSTTGGLRGMIVGLGKYEGLIAGGAPSNVDIIYHPASDPSAWYAMVADDPNLLFEVQEESNGTQLAATDVGLNTISKSGTYNGYLSGWQLPSSTGATPGTTATLQLKLFGLSRKPDNAFGAYAKWLVQINVHELAHGTGSLGV